MKTNYDAIIWCADNGALVQFVNSEVIVTVPYLLEAFHGPTFLEAVNKIEAKVMDDEIAEERAAENAAC